MLFDHAAHNGSSYLNGHCFVSVMLCISVWNTVMYDLPPKPTGKRGRPAKYGKSLSVQEDFELSDKKISGYYIGVRKVLTNILGMREVLAYVTPLTIKIVPECCFSVLLFRNVCRIFCVWQEKVPINQPGREWMKFIPLFLYSF